MDQAGWIGRVVLIGLMLGTVAARGQEADRPSTVRPPEGEAVRVPITRDTWVSAVGREADANLGGANRLKLKSIQEMTLLDIDPAPFRGRVILGATLHLRHAAAPRLWRITVSSLGSDWVEGTSPSYAPQPGSSSFNHARNPEIPWAQRGSDLTSVILGLGGTTWRMADTFAPDEKGWQRVAVQPEVVAARVAGISHGFLVFDDTGSEWTRDGEKFDLSLFPNRFVFSHESGRDKAPYMTLFLGPEDREAPAAPGRPSVEPATADIPAGEAIVSWSTPADRGPAGPLGFFVEADGQALPRYLIPMAGEAGGRVRMHLRDLDLKPGAEVSLAIRAVDGAGNVGPATKNRIRVSDRVPKPWPDGGPKAFDGRGPLPKLAGLEVAVIDELDKVHPIDGTLTPPQADGYLAANHLWDARTHTLRLHAARNEFVAFQVLLLGNAPDVRPSISFDGPDAARIPAEFGRYQAVASKRGPLPDPIVPLDAPAEEALPGRTRTSLHAELYIPHDAQAGEHRGTLTLTSRGQSLKIPVLLTVWDFTLPDYLSFLPDMNCYNLPANDLDFYRLAHRHRTVLNRVPYYQNGRMGDGMAPEWDGKTLNWSAWDRRFAPLFDGSAFADLPRCGVPIECFYLPMHENWPSPIEPNYNGDYWADRAFPPSYRDALVEVSRQMSEHFNAKGWDQTLFQFFLNGKNNFKQNGWSRGSSPWLLDEPANFQDYWALRFFGVAFHEGVDQAPGPAKMVFRADISRPQWQRDAFDGLLDYNVVGGALRSYRRMVMDRKKDNGEIVVEYGSANAIEDSNLQPVGWTLDAWSLGTDGVLPWQTVGNARSWEQADTLSLFYPGRRAGEKPIPSVRLKAFRRGQQDVEYLTLLGLVENQPRWAVGHQVREALKLAGRRRGTGFTGGEDAGVIDYGRLRPQDVWALRVRVGAALSAAGPEPKRQLVELRTPHRDLSQLRPGYASVGEVPPPPRRAPSPATSGSSKNLRTSVLQGREAVRDVLLDPERPDRPLGGQPRDNAIRKSQDVSPFLVRFDLDKLGLPTGAEVVSAELSVFVWDPSSQGRTRLAALPMTTTWDESAATWNRPAAGRRWTGGETFRVGADTSQAVGQTVVEPDSGSDIADPPVECRLDVTAAVRGWFDGQPNHGLALVPIPDRSVDEGHFTRFQIYASDDDRAAYTPRLTVKFQPAGSNAR